MADTKSLQDLEAEGAQKCPECGSSELGKRDDEIYCKKCGLVLE